MLNKHHFITFVQRFVNSDTIKAIELMKIKCWLKCYTMLMNAFNEQLFFTVHSRNRNGIVI